MNDQDITIRDPEAGDLNFILSTWLKAIYYGSEYWNLVDQEAYFKNMEPFIKKLLIKSTVKVACLSDDTDVVLGYSVYQNNSIHMIFVKKSYRKLGIGKMLYPEGIDTVSNLTTQGNAIRKKMNLKFDPFAIIL